MALLKAVRVRLAALLLCALAGAGCENPATPPPAVASVMVESPTSSLMVGDTARLTAEVRDASGGAISGRAVSWSSSSDAVVTVNARGTVTAVGPGTATVSATVEGKSDSVELTVTPVPGTLIVSVETAGELPDPDGYVVVIDGAERGAIEIDVSTGSVTPLMSTLTRAEKHPVLRRDGRIVFEVVDSEGSGPLPLH